MTVTTTVSPASRPRARRSMAQMAMSWSPSTSVAALVDGQHPVGVAVEGQPDVGAAASTTASLQRARVGRAAAGVDVRAVGLGVDDLDLGTERAGRRRGATVDAAPLAQSSTTRSPSSVRPSRAATQRGRS